MYTHRIKIGGEWTCNVEGDDLVTFDRLEDAREVRDALLGKIELPSYYERVEGVEEVKIYRMEEVS